MKLAAAFLLPALVLSAAPEVLEEILVVVNGHIITRRAFQQSFEQEHAALYRKFSGKELDEKLKEARTKTLQGLVDAFILEDKAASLGIVIPEDYLRSMVEDIKKQNNFATDADLERAVRGSLGIGLPEFMKRQKQQILQQEVLRREVFSKVAIEDQELRAYYEDHRDEYRQPSRFRIRELVVAKGATPEEEQAARTRIASIQEALKGGASFEDQVKEHSASPSKATGGDLGWMGKGLMRASLEQAALALKPGQVSAPIETDKDLYLVQLIAAEEDVVLPFQEVRPKILEKLQEPKAQNAIENFLQGLRIRANVRYLVPKDTILKG
ncbi:MAG: Foldase protein PrsA precursor [Acidobacteria bacterium ADurb.Bin340]|nr:MAG: Foldase protein PrsA precursor [Acidobacteria bacterium ADurb.Bin340]HQL47679.1 peptidyl-prolyl cis-trans isomerase [Holophaga sp.]